MPRDSVRAATLAVTSLLGACFPTHATLLLPDVRRPPICREAVVVFNTVAEVGKPYTPVADLTTHEGGPDIGASDKQLQGSQTKKAAALGANGIIRGAARNKAVAILCSTRHSCSPASAGGAA